MLCVHQMQHKLMLATGLSHMCLETLKVTHGIYFITSSIAEKQFWWAHCLTHPLVSNKLLQWEREVGAGASLGRMHVFSVAGCTF